MFQIKTLHRLTGPVQDVGRDLQQQQHLQVVNCQLALHSGHGLQQQQQQQQ
jgi:hypothetical protein